MPQSDNYQYNYIKNIIANPKKYYVSDQILSKFALRYVHSFAGRVFSLIIMAVVCYFLCQVSGFPKLIKLYTGYTLSGYTEGTGRVVDTGKKYGKYSSGCNASVEIEGISAENNAPVKIDSIPCTVRKGDQIKLIYSDKDYSKAANIDPVSAETYLDLRVVALAVLIIMEIFKLLAGWGFINIGKKSAVDKNYTPLKLKLHKMSEKERSELVREMENSEEGAYSTESFLRGIDKCAVKDEDSAFSYKISGMVLSSYCYAIKESELRKIAGNLIRESAADVSENAAEDRTIYFLSPWKLRILKPAPFVEILFGDKSAGNYVMKPIKA